MTNKQLKEQLDQYPDDLEIRVGSWYNDVVSVERKTVSINHVKHDVISITDEEEY
ncbi:hypothetical protein [uncultured Clostridium sp.]|uniref:hypothetical protein n=1 Tax=uncultured Clostridium sp. TaxID=59620 RepID=UPI00262FF823|nr:hypothetical protein [uncultured Clostridium sp.]